MTKVATKVATKIAEAIKDLVRLLVPTTTTHDDKYEIESFRYYAKRTY